MKLIKARYRNKTNRRLRDNQKQYVFICPIEDVEVGDYVLVEHYPEGKVTRFTIAHVDEVFEMSVKELMKSPYRPRFFALAKIDTKNLDKRTAQVKKMKYTLYSIYEGKHRKSGQQATMPRSEKDDIRKSQVNATQRKNYLKSKKSKVKK